MGKRKDENGSYWQNMRAYEKGLLEWALQETGDSPLRAAEMLGINTSYLYERCRIVGIVRYGRGKKPTEDVADATSSPALKLVPPVAEVEEPEDPEEELVEEEADDDSVDTEDDEAADGADGADEEADEEYEDVGDDECLCGAQLVTDDERNKWVECTECRTKRLQSRVIKSAGFAPTPAAKDDDEEETA